MVTADDVNLRPLTADDGRLVREMLYHALHVPPGASPPPPEMVDDPSLARYWRGWGRDGDLGFAALSPVGSPAGCGPVGAAWVRLLTGTEAGYGHVDDQTPELSVAVLAPWQNRGVGTRLLARLLRSAGERHPAVSLSVQADNPAHRLYERLGFTAVRRDGPALVMLKRPRDVAE